MQSDLWYRAMPGTIVTVIPAGGLAAAGLSFAAPVALAAGSAFAAALAALVFSPESAAGLLGAGLPFGAALAGCSVVFAASAALDAAGALATGLVLPVGRAGALASARSAGLAEALVACAATRVFSLVDGPRAGIASGGVPAAERAGAGGASAGEAAAAG
jgi:hypothetical protein